MDSVFQALANPVRRRILDTVRADPGSCVGDVYDQFEIYDRWISDWSPLWAHEITALTAIKDRVD